MKEPADHNRRVVSLLIAAISRGDTKVFDEFYTPRAAAKAGRGWSRSCSLFRTPPWT